MDEASKLVGELQQKLSELDLKVWKYRQDMATEFEKYAEDLLRNVPMDVSETVWRAMVEAMKGFKELYPKTATTVESSVTRSLENGLSGGGAFSQTLTLPIPTPRSQEAPLSEEEDMDGSSPRIPRIPRSPRSQRQREKEFQGVFTPSYLPLLDSTSRNERRSSYDQKIKFTPPGFKGKEREDETSQVDASTDTGSLANTPEASRPPTPHRKNTDEWSIGSDHSDGIRRRSALRRSSNSSNRERGSPRRVRFEVAGMEVLPTSSPQSKSAMSSGGPTSSCSDEDDYEAGSEMIEDVEKPPTKRISSSQALRNLSRSPLVDDGTQWTTVTAPPDGSASVATAIDVSEDSYNEDLYASDWVSQSNAGSTPNGSGTAAELSSQHVSSSNSKPQEPQDTLSEDDEDVLDMPPMRRHRGSQAASMLSPVNPPSIDGKKSPISVTPTWQGKDKFGLGSDLKIHGLEFTKDEDDDDLFRFDETLELGTTPNSTKWHSETHNDEERDSFDPITSTDDQDIASNKYSDATSLARPIMRSSDGPMISSVGSYKGHPFSMPIVNPDVHAQAASIGHISSFVGSVNGRSGLDESNVQSFRASVGSFSVTPKSMSERFMMEQLKEAEKNPGRRER